MDARQNFWTNDVCYLSIVPASMNGFYYIPIIPTFELEISTERSQRKFFGGQSVPEFLGSSFAIDIMNLQNGLN